MGALDGKVALVTGTSRGAGRGIAVELGLAGATVYVTGRTLDAGFSRSGFPGTLADTVREIEAGGGTAIAVRCDHTKDDETAAVVDRIRSEHGRLHILVNNVWGAHELPLKDEPFWQLPLAHWDTMFTAGVRAQVATNHFAVPLLRETAASLADGADDEGQARGLIVHTTFWDRDQYIGMFYYDLAKHALTRMAFGLAHELRTDDIAVVALSPGWMRTELVLAAFGVDEARWQDVPELARTESPRYIGRAVVALACDRAVMARSGRVWTVGQLADEYGFTDVDGRHVPPFRLSP